MSYLTITLWTLFSRLVFRHAHTVFLSLAHLANLWPSKDVQQPSFFSLSVSFTCCLSLRSCQSSQDLSQPVSSLFLEGNIHLFSERVYTKRFLKVLSLFFSLSLSLKTENVKLQYLDVFSAWLKPEWKRGFAFLDEGCKTHPSQRLTISNSSLFTFLTFFFLSGRFRDEVPSVKCLLTLSWVPYLMRSLFSPPLPAVFSGRDFNAYLATLFKFVIMALFI